MRVRHRIPSLFTTIVPSLFGLGISPDCSRVIAKDEPHDKQRDGDCLFAFQLSSVCQMRRSSEPTSNRSLSDLVFDASFFRFKSKPGTTAAPAAPFTILLANNPNNVSYAAVPGSLVEFSGT